MVPTPIDIDLPTMPIAHSKIGTEEFYYGQFPDHFKWGSSSSAYQVESFVNFDGKGQTWWDNMCRKNRKAIADKSRGDCAADSYRRFEQDVMLLKAMNANCYKFSLSWSRILPNGTLTEINKSAFDYYDDLINTLVENGIEPIIVLYHWDLPQDLVDKYPNTWLDDELVQCFANYARLCFKKFGDRVRRWITIQDPWSHSVSSFGNGNHPPGIQGWKDGLPHKVYQQLLKAHSLAYQIYYDEFKLRQKGNIGISGNSKFIPLKSSLISSESIDDSNDNNNNNNNNNNLKRTSSQSWTELLKMPFDFLTLDHEANNVSKNEVIHNPVISNCLKSDRTIRNILNTIKDHYGNPPTLLCASGVPLKGADIENLVNLEQILYFKQTANEILKSVVMDGCNVAGFLPGTLVDSWEWEYGFTISYGLHRVDFDHPIKPRTARSTAKYLYRLFKTNGFSRDWDIGTIALN